MNRGNFGAFSGRRKAGGILRPIWESPDTGTIAIGSNYSWTHGLGRVPKLVTYGARRISDGLEYYNVYMSDTISGNYTFIPWHNSNSCNVPGADINIYVTNGSAGALVSLLGGNHRFFARIWA